MAVAQTNGLDGRLITNDLIHEWLLPMFQLEERENVTVNITGTCGKGESFLSDIHYIEVKDRTTRRLEFSLMVKSGKRGIALRQLVNLHRLNETERTFYTVVLPLFRDLGNQRNGAHLGCIDMVPEIFHFHRVEPEDGEEEEVLVLQDLKKLDYDLHPRDRPMNVDHLRQVVKTYARFHAISYGYLYDSPDGFVRACGRLGNPMEHIRLESILDEQGFFRQLTAVCDDDELKNRIQYLADMVENPEVDGPVSCIIHGDCDITNYMFKYNPSGTVKHVYFLDWQFARLGPVIYDLSYFLFACMSPTDLPHFDDLKELYFVTFKDVFERLRFDQRFLFSREEYERQWLIHARFGLRMMCSVMKNQLATDAELCDFEKLAANATGVQEVPGGVLVMDPLEDEPTKCTYSEDLVRRCAERMFPIIKFCIQRQFI